ncbi:MAG TPA: MqnA/MqnD/SBP family protein [Gemmataceae bacterium]|jgi:1,4-dihydroxy-6-naphthoate synthase|nr:MqnA/MqnD/SBP family protein [Gemmataceae bacterium]
MATERPLSIACTPDSDDAFYYEALEAGRVRLAGFRPEFCREPMSVLNRAALVGRYDVTAISSVIYPQIAERYAILSVGTSVGRGYGPVLVSRRARPLDDLGGSRVGVGGIPTTGWFLLRRFCPEAVPVEMPFDRIADAVAAGELEAGVMIHEELLYYPQVGLRRVADLGAVWCREHDLPLPVGLNVIRRDLGVTAMERVCAAIRRSLQYGLDHAPETLARVSRFGRREAGGCTGRFVTMFANADSVQMPADVRSALRVLFRQVADQGLAAQVPSIDVIEGCQPARRVQRSRAA